MHDEIRERFRFNLERVRNLTRLYDTVTRDGSGRRTVAEQDILRSAVVFLHATLEDLFRSIAEWRLLPSPPAGFLRDLPYPSSDGRNRATKFNLEQLSRYRGQSVDDVIEDAVTGYLERSNYNNAEDLAVELRRCGIDASDVSSHAARVAPMMNRRHWIVHRADAALRQGAGHHRARSISKGTVETWLEAVRSLGEALLVRLAAEEATEEAAHVE